MSMREINERREGEGGRERCIVLRARTAKHRADPCPAPPASQERKTNGGQCVLLRSHQIAGARCDRVPGTTRTA